MHTLESKKQIEMAMQAQCLLTETLQGHFDFKTFSGQSFAWKRFRGDFLKFGGGILVGTLLWKSGRQGQLLRGSGRLLENSLRSPPNFREATLSPFPIEHLVILTSYQHRPTKTRINNVQKARLRKFSFRSWRSSGRG